MILHASAGAPGLGSAFLLGSNMQERGGSDAVFWGRRPACVVHGGPKRHAARQGCVPRGQKSGQGRTPGRA